MLFIIMLTAHVRDPGTVKYIPTYLYQIPVTWYRTLPPYEYLVPGTTRGTRTWYRTSGLHVSYLYGTWYSRTTHYIQVYS